MNKPGIKAPVLLFTYRRIECLDEIFDAIRTYSPPALYVASNGPNGEEEAGIVDQIREKIRAWRLPCEIHPVFSQQHLLINDSIQQGLDRVTDHEDTVIVLEDDTVPTPAFFEFCNTMLASHRHNLNIGSIVGHNLGIKAKNNALVTPLAIFYWGWATWADRWKTCRRASIPWETVSEAPPVKPGEVPDKLLHFLARLDDRTTWDVQWAVKQLLQRQQVIIPGSNLVSNRGFTPSGSYVRHTRSAFANIPTNTPIQITDIIGQNPDKTSEYLQKTEALIEEILYQRGEREKYFSDLP